MQLGKNIKIFINYFLGPLLFVWLAFSIYKQILRQPQLEERHEERVEDHEKAPGGRGQPVRGYRVKR